MVPFVLLTPAKEKQDLIKGYELGANSYVQNPVNFLEFVEAAGRLGIYWLMLNEPPPAQRS